MSAAHNVQQTFFLTFCEAPACDAATQCVSKKRHAVDTLLHFWRFCYRQFLTSVKNHKTFPLGRSDDAIRPL